jgi:ABC-2 type transport system ATP-binding protein
MVNQLISKENFMIEIQEVTKEFGALTALDDFSLKVESGTVLGLLGPNGAGKTTMMRIIAGYLQPTSGTVVIDGEDIGGARRNINRRIGYLPENNPLYEDMLVEEYLKFVADLHGIKGSKAETEIERVVEETGLEDVYYKSVDSLSKGYRQRLGIASAIIHNPDILILDEPTEGLDPNQRVEIRSLIKRIGKTSTVIISTHVMQEVSATCDRLAIINRGALVAEGTTHTLLQQAQGSRMQVIVEVSGSGSRAAFGKVNSLIVEDVQKSDKRRTRLTLTSAGSEDIRPDVFKAAVDGGLVIYEMYSLSLIHISEPTRPY